MKDELQGSITSERTRWGALISFSGCIQNILSPNDGTGGRRHPQLGCIMKTSFPFARSITSGLAGFFCRSRTRFDISFKFPIFCLFFMFLYFQLCAVWKCRAVVTQFLLECCLAGPGMSVHSKRWAATVTFDNFRKQALVLPIQEKSYPLLH